MEENFSMEWNIEWKIFSMEWKKIASMEYGKNVFHSILYHALVFCRAAKQYQIKSFIFSLLRRRRVRSRQSLSSRHYARKHSCFRSNFVALASRWQSGHLRRNYFTCDSASAAIILTD